MYLYKLRNTSTVLTNKHVTLYDNLLSRYKTVNVLTMFGFNISDLNITLTTYMVTK